MAQVSHETGAWQIFTRPLPRIGTALVILQLFIAVALAQERPSPEWKPLLEAPENLPHVLTIPPPANPGRRMELRGRVLESDGKTPAPGVIVYFHHTDGKGIYARPADSRPSEWVYWHGSIRGWLKSDAEGRYVLKTTRPGPYPEGRTPAHIHCYGLPAGSNEGVVFPGIVFAGDPFLTASDEGIVTLTEDKDGVLQGSFDLVIPRS